jgi:hypothetical protein
MATCLWCNKAGFFLRVSKEGLCSNCMPIITMDVQQRARIIMESFKIATKTKSFKTRLSRCELILEHARELKKYESAGIKTIDPCPSRIIEEYQSTRDEIIIENLDAEIDKAVSKSELTSSSKTAVNSINASLLKIREAKGLLNDPDKVADREERMKKLAHKIQLNGHLEAARKAEFKGQTKKAIDQYQEALYFLKNDDIDDSKQKKEIQEIEENLARLQKDN